MKLRLISFLISLVIFLTLIYFLDIELVISSIRKAEKVSLLLISTFSFVLMGIKTARWQLLLRKINLQVNLKRLFPIFMSSIFVSYLAPLKSGDPYRSYLLKKAVGIPFSRSFPSIVMERFLDLGTLLLISLMSVYFMPLPTSEFQNILKILLILFLLSTILFLFIISNKKRANLFSKKIFKILQWSPKSDVLKEKTKKLVSNFTQAFIEYKKVKTLLIGFSISLAVWLLEGSLLLLAFNSLGIQLNLFYCFSILSIATLVGIVPSLLGGWGSSEFLMILLSTSLFSIPLSLATAGVVIASFISTGLNMIVGAVFFNLT